MKIQKGTHRARFFYHRIIGALAQQEYHIPRKRALHERLHLHTRRWYPSTLREVSILLQPEPGKVFIQRSDTSGRSRYKRGKSRVREHITVVLSVRSVSLESKGWKGGCCAKGCRWEESDRIRRLLLIVDSYSSFLHTFRPLHPTSTQCWTPSVSLPLIIPYLYVGPFGSQWRYLASSDEVDASYLITQSVGQTKEGCNSRFLPTRNNVFPPFLHFSPPTFTHTLAFTPSTHWRWGIKPLPIRL